jgi:hypothetical protein
MDRQSPHLGASGQAGRTDEQEMTIREGVVCGRRSTTAMRCHSTARSHPAVSDDDVADEQVARRRWNIGKPSARRCSRRSPHGHYGLHVGIETDVRSDMFEIFTGSPRDPARSAIPFGNLSNRVSAARNRFVPMTLVPM